MARLLALDSNLTLLLVVGRAERSLVGRHKRLRQYSEADFELLLGAIAGSERILTTPNAMTEVSNIATFGITDETRDQVVSSLQSLIDTFYEVYRPSKELAQLQEFSRLGLADCAWLGMLESHTRFLTVDLALYLAASARGFDAVNFNHLREQFS